jgi:hypothetical protein
MRIALLAVFLTGMLAGCVGGSGGGNGPLFTSMANCETTDMADEAGSEDVSGTFWECTEVVGKGWFTLNIMCAADEIGFIGVEYEDGNSTVAVTVTWGDATKDHYNITANSEEFVTVPGDERVSARLQTQADFHAQVLRFGTVCFPEEFLS